MKKWETHKLGDICIIERGGSPRPIDDYITNDDNGVNWIKIGDANRSMYITKTAQKIKPAGVKKSRTVHKGDFLLSNSMSFGRPYILAIDGCIHDGWLVIRDEREVFDKRFLFYFLSSPTTYLTFTHMAVGGVVNNLNSEMVRRLIVPVPHKQEQVEIADKLDKIENLIQQRKTQIELFDDLVKSQFIEMFGNPVHNDKGWNIKLLDAVAEIGSSKRVFEREYTQEGIPFFRTKEIVELAKGHPISTELFISRDRYDEIKATYGCPQKGDLLISAVGTIGIIWVVDDRKFYFKDGNLLQVRIRNNESPDFLKYVLEWLIDDYKKGMAKGTAYSALTINSLKNIRLIDVPLSLQNEFARFVEQTDKSKFRIKQSLEKLEKCYKALLQKYFG